jgi:MoaA/NifB/PqqE/SkfB family radical SAM enzyme
MNNAAAASSSPPSLDMIWAEITGECQLACTHCYAGSGPGKGHGTMTTPEWEHVITQAASLGARQITFIGGEPTLHPHLPALVRRALTADVAAEIYTNLVHVTPAMWELFTLPGVSLATSWYTSDRRQHAAITGRDTWRQTRANITQAARHGIPTRAGIIDGIIPAQQAADAERQLRALGIADTGHDHVREFGRGTLPAPDQACGNCGRGRAAILPDGTVTPCPLTRWLTAGHVRETKLSTIMETVTSMAATLPARAGKTCNPDDCHPDTYCAPLCTPSACKPNI